MFIPITSSKKYNFGFLSLNKAFEEGLVEVKELDDDGSVPEVKVYNKSEKFLIIFDGEHLIGAKQNRIVNKTIIIKTIQETTNWFPENLQFFSACSAFLTINLGNIFLKNLSSNTPTIAIIAKILRKA